MMRTIPGNNDFKSLTIPPFKIYMNTEHDTLKKSARQAVLDHSEERNENSFFSVCT